MPIIITRLSDESVVARDTAAWFVGRACDIVPEAAINENYFEKLLVAMVQGLQVSFSIEKNSLYKKSLGSTSSRSKYLLGFYIFI